MSALPRVLALDFDGVICDGMPEYFESSLRAHRLSFGETPDPGGREELFGRFKVLRPAVETGWEMVVLVDMLTERDPSGDRELRERWASVRDGWVSRKAIEPKKLADALLPGIPDMQLPIEDVIAEGEKVLVRLRVKGTHGGDLMGVPATGRKIDIAVLDLFQIREGKLIEHWALLDNLGLLRQIGVTTI